VAEGTTYGALKKPHTILDLISFNTGLKALQSFPVILLKDTRGTKKIRNTINHSLELLWQTVAHQLLLMNQAQTGEEKLRSKVQTSNQTLIEDSELVR